MATAVEQGYPWHNMRTALVLAHPGHEVLLHRFMEETRPVVFVLTTGKARDGELPISTTMRIVRRAGGKIGSIFGRCTDKGLLQAFIRKEKTRFNALAQELADAFLLNGIEFVVGDPAEGIDPAHDLCRLLIDTASAIAARIQPALKNYEYPLCSRPMFRASSKILKVEGEAWFRKYSACKAYAHPVEDVKRIIACWGIDALREEQYLRATPWSIQRRQGIIYTSRNDQPVPAVHFQDHFLPVAHELLSYISGNQNTAA